MPASVPTSTSRPSPTAFQSSDCAATKNPKLATTASAFGIEVEPGSWTPEHLRSISHDSKDEATIHPSFRRRMFELQPDGRSPGELAAERSGNWVAQAERDAGRGNGGLTSTEREELNRFREARDHELSMQRRPGLERPSRSENNGQKIRKRQFRPAGVSADCPRLTYKSEIDLIVI